MATTSEILANPTTRARYLETMTAAYLECALWADTPDDERDAWAGAELHETARARAAAECAAFLWRASPWLDEWTADAAGHDFWLTRNGHGAGFWDRVTTCPAAYGEILTNIAHAFGEVNLYLGDDGAIYIS